MSKHVPVKPSAMVELREAPPSARAGNTIRVVSKRTGLPMDTLRAWERRYGFPAPERRPGSNRRLYSDADIERLVAIGRALERGYRVGDVVRMTLPELEALAGVVHVEPGARGLRHAPSEVATLIDLLARDDAAGLEAELRHAAAALGPKRFVTDVAHPFAVAVGAAWAHGRLGVRHEHLATECLITRLRHLLAAYQDVEGRPLVLLTTLPGEPHTLALQMVALYLAVSAAKPRLLGASTPPEQIVEAAGVFGADVVGLTVTPTSDGKEARRAVRVLTKELPPRVRIWVGGGGASALDPRTVRVVSSWSAMDEALGEWRREARRA